VATGSEPLVAEEDSFTGAAEPFVADSFTAAASAGAELFVAEEDSFAGATAAGAELFVAEADSFTGAATGEEPFAASTLLETGADSFTIEVVPLAMALAMEATFSAADPLTATALSEAFVALASLDTDADSFAEALFAEVDEEELSPLAAEAESLASVALPGSSPARSEACRKKFLRSREWELPSCSETLRLRA